jgi:predicted nucleic acid-binding protein
LTTARPDVVLDASIAVRVLLSAGDVDRALRDRVHGSWCHAPHLIDAEVGRVLRRRVAAGSIEEDSAAAALAAMRSLITDRYPHTAIAAAAWRLRHNLTYYDALYVALAARLGCPLLTADARLARAPGLPCGVQLAD